VIEKQLEESMHAALAGEPPLGFDPDEVIDRAGRRQRQRRSAVATVSAAVTVLAVAVTTVLVTSSRGEGPNIGTPTAPATTTSTTRPATVCQSVKPGTVPPSGFPGSADVLDRFDQDLPDAVVEHLGITVVPADDIVAYDCPPTVGVGYAATGSSKALALSFIHARPKLDLAHDPYVGDKRFALLQDKPQAGGARLRVYAQYATWRDSPVIVLWFGADGMVTEVSAPRQDYFARADLIALASDPRLAFPLPR
jgi:hypothetical protein